jgi:hypothetical protein
MTVSQPVIRSYSRTFYFVRSQIHKKTKMASNNTTNQTKRNETNSRTTTFCRPCPLNKCRSGGINGKGTKVQSFGTLHTYFKHCMEHINEINVALSAKEANSDIIHYDFIINKDDAEPPVGSLFHFNDYYFF